MSITASMVKELREKTGAGMMDCKKALQEVEGDLEKAIDWLRQKGLSKAAKKAGRATSEGLVGFEVAADGKSAALIEVKCETDFVARGDQVPGLRERHGGPGSPGANTLTPKRCSPLLSWPTPPSSVKEALMALSPPPGENMGLGKFAKMELCRPASSA